jgi:hypothetical protein
MNGNKITSLGILLLIFNHIMHINQGFPTLLQDGEMSVCQDDVLAWYPEPTPCTKSIVLDADELATVGHRALQVCDNI